jgi:chaperonin GroES
VRTTALTILGDRVLIRADAVLTTEGGIYLPESAQEKPRRGTVLAVGEGKRLKSGTLVAPDLAVGDRVLYAKYGGTEVKVDGEELLIMNTIQILGKYSEGAS